MYLSAESGADRQVAHGDPSFSVEWLSHLAGDLRFEDFTYWFLSESTLDSETQMSSEQNDSMLHNQTSETSVFVVWTFPLE